MSLLVGRFERASIHEGVGLLDSASPTFPRLPNEGFSLAPFTISSELSLVIKPLNLLSPFTLPNPGLFSDGIGCVGLDPIAKLPNAPIGEKPALCGVADHGEEGPVIPTLNGAVVVRLRLPKDPIFSEAPSRVFSFSRSSAEDAVAESFKSVLRRTSAGGGVTVLGSSRENLEAADGEAVELEGNGNPSPVSRRRLLGRALVGEARPYGPEGF